MNYNLYKKGSTAQVWITETFDERMRWYTGLRINPDHWSGKCGNGTIYSSFNAELDKIESIYKEIKRQLDKQNKLTASNVKYLLDCEGIFKSDNYINEIIEGIKSIPVKGEFAICFQRFIDDSKSGKRKKKKGGKLSLNTVAKYNVAFNFIKKFSKDCNYDLTWKNINYTFYERFTEFAWKEGHYDNNVGTMVNVIFAFLNWCVSEKIIHDKIYDSKWIAWKEDEVDALVLYPDEIPLLYNMPLDKLEETRDLFIFGCLTLLRGGNLLSLDESDLKIVGNTWYLSPVQIKVGGKLWIKLHSTAVDIIKKYRGKYKTLLPEMSHGLYADNLKRLAKKFKDHLEALEQDKKLDKGIMTNEWNKPFTRVRYRQGVPIKIQCDPTDLLNPHTERSTGVTNLLILGMREFEVKKIGGFSKNSTAFNKYVRIAQRFIDSKSDEAWDKIFTNVQAPKNK